jgi:hypothetical protein
MGDIIANIIPFANSSRDGSSISSNCTVAIAAEY